MTDHGAWVDESELSPETQEWLAALPAAGGPHAVMLRFAAAADAEERRLERANEQRRAQLRAHREDMVDGMRWRGQGTAHAPRRDSAGGGVGRDSGRARERVRNSEAEEKALRVAQQPADRIAELEAESQRSARNLSRANESWGRDRQRSTSARDYEQYTTTSRSVPTIYVR